MEYLFCDVLIIGIGAAGLRAAISARQKGLDVCVVSKQSPGKASCTILSAGDFAATQEGTSPDQHLNRTLQAGRGINQHELVKVLVDEGPIKGGGKNHFYDSIAIYGGNLKNANARLKYISGIAI